MEEKPNVLNVITKDKLTLIKRNLSEIVLVVLSFSVAFLFKLYIDLNNDFKKYLIDDRRELIEVLKDFNNAIRNNK